MASSRANSAADIPQLLSVRMVSKAPSLLATFLIGIFVTGVGLGVWLIRNKVHGEGSWIVHTVGILFGAIGLLLLWSWFRLLMASSIPKTILELSEQPFILGQTAQAAVIQSGPAKLRSLRVNLVYLMQTITYPKHQSSGRTSSSSRHISEKLLFTETLLELNDLKVAAGDQYRQVQDFTLPAQITVPKPGENQTLLWKIEIWGQGYGQASFKETFDLEVVQDEKARIALKKAYEDEARESGGD